MLHKALLALGFCLVASSAWAQNPQCPTRPTGDNSNACASTAFVQNNAGQISGPGSAVVGNIAFWTNTSGTNLGAALSYHSLNPGQAALYSVVANPALGYLTLNNGLQVSLGAPLPSTQQFGTNLNGVMQAIVGTVSIPAGDTTTIQTCGICGYAITNAADDGFGPGAVGVFGQGLTTVAGADTFGGNMISVNTNGDQNSIGFDMNYMAALELDVLVWQKAGGIDATVANGHVYGLTIAGASNMSAVIPNSSGVVVDRLSFQTNIPWDFGYSTYAGATRYALMAGPLHTGINQDSQPIAFQYSDASGIPQIGPTIYGDSGANLILRSGINGTIVAIQDKSGTNLMDLSTSFGGGKVRIPAFTSAGVVTNDITTGQLNSVTTLPSGLTAPALNVTTSFSIGGTPGISKTCTIAVGQVLTFTLGILTATSGTAGCV